MRIGRTMKLSRIVGNAYDQSREYEKTRYPQLMWTPGKAFMEFTDSNVAVRIPIRTHCGLIWLIWFLGRNGFYSGVFR